MKEIQFSDFSQSFFYAFKVEKSQVFIKCWHKLFYWSFIILWYRSCTQTWRKSMLQGLAVKLLTYHRITQPESFVPSSSFLLVHGWAGASFSSDLLIRLSWNKAAIILWWYHYHSSLSLVLKWIVLMLHNGIFLL